MEIQRAHLVRLVFLGATNHQGSRYKASWADRWDNYGKTKHITWAREYDLSNDDYIAKAAQAFLDYANENMTDTIKLEIGNISTASLDNATDILLITFKHGGE